MTIKTDKKTGAQWREPPYSREEEREINRTINSAPISFTSHLQSGPYTHPYSDLVSVPEEDFTCKYCAIYKDGVSPKFVYRENDEYAYDTKEEAKQALQSFLANNPQFTEGGIGECLHEYTPEGWERQKARIALVDKLMAEDAARK